MAFVKLDSAILTSTLWPQRDCREIFITALLMAEPFEARQPMKQIEVDSLEFTGYEIPAGWYGMVPSAGVGIIRLAGIKQSAGLEALRKLGSPDLESRSQDFEGRRMIRVDGGFILLNFIKYRERDHTTRERSKRYRERHAVTTRNHAVTTRDVTQAEAEAEVQAEEEKKKKVPPAPAAAAPTSSSPKKAKKVQTSALKPASMEAFEAVWATPPKVFAKWDKDAKAFLDEPVSKGSRLKAERAFQAVVDSGVCPPAELYYAFFAYITEGPGPKKGYFQAVSTFFGPEKATYLEWLDRGRQLAKEGA